MTKDEEQKSIIDAHFKSVADAKRLARTDEDYKKDMYKLRKALLDNFWVEND